MHQHIFEANEVKIFRWLHHFTNLVPFSFELLKQVLVRLHELRVFWLWLDFYLLGFRKHIAAILRTFQVRLRLLLVVLLLGDLAWLRGFHSLNLASRGFRLRFLLD
jgi:hypothetical protein